MTKKEKLELYYQAKEAYYNGQEIMTDLEFDELEKELGLENKAEVGAKRNPSYTVKHPFMMGSISKVQIHKDKEGNIDWDKYYTEAKKYFGNKKLIITPKFDGCSFEVDIFDNLIQSISTRGDGSWGKDITKHIAIFVPDEYVKLGGHYTLRGEVLIKKDIFEKKYAEEFTNPRSFVAGVLGRDYNQFDPVLQERIMDLSIVIYDYRRFEDGEWIDHEFNELPKSNVLPDMYEFLNNGCYSKNIFEEIYNDFANYRHNCEYALDGIVIKPVVSERINNTSERRPSDCVAIKFIPMLEETEVVDITWKLGKTQEYTPIIWVKPVEMDGRMVKKCSGHNLGYLRNKGITVGAKIIMSLAGDIIPFMYKVTQPNEEGNIPMPTDHEYYEDDIHLMALLSEDDVRKYKFLNSVSALNIPTVGGQTAKEIFEYLGKNDTMTMEFFGEEPKKLPFNILLISPEEVYFVAGAGKTGENAKKNFVKILDAITLNDIIKSCDFHFCGGKVTEQVVNYLLNGEADWSHLATEGYSWIFDKNSTQWQELNEILNYLGKDIADFKVQHQEAQKTSSNQIPVILTGEPNNYKTKAEFLKLNPQYRNTTSWKEVQIVFTNSLESNTGKMKKAREKNIEIQLY